MVGKPPPHGARAVLYALICIGSPFLATSCGSLPRGQGWGNNATLFQKPRTIWDGFKTALLDPWTVGPLAAAAVFSIEDWDEEVSEWAIRETPIFGSNDTASDWSDYTRDTLEYSSYATTLLTDSGEDNWYAAWSKTKGIGVFALSVTTTAGVTDKMKDEIGRMRPDGSNARSTPSRHAGLAMNYARWSADNVDYIHMPDGLRTPTKVTFYTLALLTAWARVEGAHHYPMDVSLGMALGNFSAVFFREAFMGLPDTIDLNVRIDPINEEVEVGFSWSPF